MNKFKNFLFLPIIFISLFFCLACERENNNFDLVGIGNKYYVEHNYDEALNLYEKALAKGYRSFDVFHNLGSIYFYEKKDYKKAEEIFLKGVSIYPNVDILHSALSQLYFQTNKFSEAVREYKLAVRLGRDRPIRMNSNKARELLEQQGKSKEEIYNFFLEIVAFNPKDSYALYEVADYEKKNGKYSQALDRYKIIIKLNPNMKNEIIKDMGNCYYKLGDYKSALLYFEEARKIGDFVPEQLLQEIKNKLKQK